MSVIELEEAVSRLAPGELAEFRAWFAEYTASRWDRQLDEDAQAGRLDALAAEALDDLKNGRCTEL